MAPEGILEGIPVALEGIPVAREGTLAEVSWGERRHRRPRQEGSQDRHRSGWDHIELVHRSGYRALATSHRQRSLARKCQGQ